jgi:hypothetical protein
MALATSSARIPFWRMIMAKSSRVARKMSSRVLASAVVAPRTPRHGMMVSFFETPLK